MPPDTLFQFANTGVLAGWLALALYPLAPRVVTVVALAFPLALALLYCGLVLANWAGAAGDFTTLAGVMQLFTTPELALAGWVHYLAFDMLVGLWIARAARSNGIPHLLVLPCLGLTLMFGPAGFLSFVGLATALRKEVFA